MFYFFGKNNSGGVFFGPKNIIIEADCADEANERAEKEAGIYFNGVGGGRDCECCGDRWYRASDDLGVESPSCYREPVEIIPDAVNGNGIIYYKDGRKAFFEVTW